MSAKRWLMAVGAGVFLGCSGTVAGQAKKTLPETVTIEADGSVVLKNLPDTLTLTDDRPHLARLGEWLAKYYACPVTADKLSAISGRLGAEFEKDDWDHGGFDLAVALFRKEDKLFGIRIAPQYALDNASYFRLVKDYNRQAKRDKMPEIPISDSSEHWSGGIRCELEEAKLETLIRTAEKNGMPRRIMSLVRKEIEAGRPMGWVRLCGLGALPLPKAADAEKDADLEEENDPADRDYGVAAAVLVGFHPERNEFYFVDLDCRSPLRRSVSCATAAAVTWALYQATPLRKAAPAAPAPGKP